MAVLAIPVVMAAAAAAADVAIVGLAAATVTGVMSAAMIGMTVGMMIAQQMFPVTTTTATTGPRLTDRTVTSSTYGAVIPWGTGTASVGGNVIWANPLREQTDTTTQSSGGKGFGGGKSSASSTTYSYYGTFALSLGEGVVSSVLKIWADGNLVYDVTPGSTVTQKAGFNFRFYPGDEEQMPDSLIEAALGVGNVPAFRGLAYLVFDDIPLVDYSNRIPSFMVEIAYADADAPAADLVTMASPSILSTPDAAELAGDWRNGWAWTASYLAPAGLRRMDVNLMVEDRQALWADVTTDAAPLHALFVGQDSGLYGGVNLGSNYAAVVRVDPVTMKETARFGYSSGFPHPDTFQNVSSLGGMTLFAPLTGTRNFLLCAGQFQAVGILSIPDMGLVWQDGDGLGSYLRTLGCVGGVVEDGLAEGWVLYSNVIGGLLGGGGTLELHKITLTDSLVPPSLLGGPSESLDASVDVISFTADQLDPDATGFTGWAGAVCYDRADGGVMFSAGVILSDGSSTSVAVKWIDGVGLAWTTRMPAGMSFGIMPGFGYGTSWPDGVSQIMLINSTLVQLDAGTGRVMLQQSSPYHTEGLVKGQIFDGDLGIIFARVTGGNYAKIYVGRKAALPVSVGEVVADICYRAGMNAGQIDVTQLHDMTVVGFMLDQVVTAASAIAPLAQAFLFNPVEIDNKIVFVKRGGAAVATITQDSFVRPSASPSGTPEPYTETWAQQIDLPSVLSVTYNDPALDFAVNTQQWQRNKGPDPTVPSQNQSVISLPISMSANQAIQTAQMLLGEAWMARHTFSAMLSSQYLWLTPADPVNLVLGGLSIRVRAVTLAIGADFSLQITFLAESAAQYFSTATAPVVAPAPSHIPILGPTELFILDVPLLRDWDSVGAGGLHQYWAAAPVSDKLTGWPGCFLSVSAGSMTTLWSDVGTDLAPSAWGTAETALADPVSTARVDDQGSLTVTVRAGADGIESITDAALVAGFNAMALLKADGSIEVLQFRDAVSLGSGRFVLSTFLRGRRGTDAMAYGHAAGERFVMLSSATLRQVTLPTAALGSLRYWRSATIGWLPEAGEVSSTTPAGRDQMPYAPVHVAAALAGADINLTWVRRTRIGGAQRDGTGTVPLSEASEAYQVDILVAPGGAVLRTLSSTTPAVTYPAAEIAADFGATPAALPVRVYQMSAAVGRGFTREVLAELS